MAGASGIHDESRRCVLDGVPRVGFDLYKEERDGLKRCPEGIPFPSCLRACLEYLGDTHGYRQIEAHGSSWRLDNLCTYLMGTSGAAWRLAWRRGEWFGGNCDIVFTSEDPVEPFRRALGAVGYGWHILLRPDCAEELAAKDTPTGDEAEMRAAIVESIRDKGRPVIGLGVVGPPEACIVTGYDDGGDVLVGWSYFQNSPEVEKEPSGCFRKRDWAKGTLGVLTIGDKSDKPPLSETYRETLKWAVRLARTPGFRGFHSGLAAYDGWAEALTRDEDFAGVEMNWMSEPYMAHEDAVGAVAEGRWYGAQFLKQVADAEPAMADELLAAAACYEAEHDLMWKTWGLIGGPQRTDESAQKLCDPDVRRQMVAIIRQARDKDAEAADHLERALAK